MPLNINALTAEQFCDIQGGFDESNKPVVVKKYGNQIKSYDEWFVLVSREFELSPKKDFTPVVKKEKKEITDK